MLLHKGNHIILTLLLLAFIGQSVASVGVPCSMPDQSSNTSMTMLDMDGMDHSTHTNGADDVEKSIDTCCDDYRSCPTNGCISTMMLSGTCNVPGVHMSSNKMDFYKMAFVEAITPPLYRPPTSR